MEKRTQRLLLVLQILWLSISSVVLHDSHQGVQKSALETSFGVTLGQASQGLFGQKGEVSDPVSVAERSMEDDIKGESVLEGEMVMSSDQMVLSGLGGRASNAASVLSSSVAVQPTPEGNASVVAEQTNEIADIGIESEANNDLEDSIGNSEFKEEEVAEEKIELAKVVDQSETAIEKALIQSGEPVETPEEKAAVKEEAEEIMELKEIEDTSMSRRESPVETKVEFQGFDDVCKKDILSGDVFITRFLVREHVDQNIVMNGQAVAILASKIEAHSLIMKGYEKFLVATKGLVDSLYSQYVPFRMLKIVGHFEKELGMTTTCKPTAFAFTELKGKEATSMQKDIEPRMKDYLKEWENQSLEIGDYRNLGRTFYDELSLLSDVDRQKSIDQHAKYTAEVKTLEAGLASYKHRLDEMNECMCAVLKEIVYSFAGQKERQANFNSRMGKVSDHSDLKKASFREFTIELFDSFSQTMQVQFPQKCGDATRTLQEMIFYSRVGKYLTDPAYAKLKVSIDSNDGVWGAFFGMFSELSVQKYSSVIEYDHYMLAARKFSKEMFAEMDRFREAKTPFHPEFFNLMSDFPTFFSKPGFGGQRMTVVSLRKSFESAEKTISISDFKEDAEHGAVFMLRIWEALYKIYVFLRVNGAVTQSSTLANIFEMICEFLNSKTYFDSDPSSIYTELFEQASYSVLYPHLFSYVETLLEKEVHGKSCIKEETLKAVIPKVPPKDPKDKERIEIHKIIAAFFLKFQIEAKVKSFKQTFIDIGWAITKCPKGKFTDYDYEKSKSSSRTVIKKTLKPNDTTFGGAKQLAERTVYRFTKECVTPYLPKVEDVMTKGYAMLKSVKFEGTTYHKVMIRVILEVIEESAYEVRGLIYHVLLRWMCRENKDIAKISEDKKMIIFLMFEVVETRVLRMLNYYETAGFYGSLMRMVLESGFSSNKVKFKHLNDDWESFDKIMDIELIDRDMLRSDMFYLVEQAILMTAAKEGEGNMKIFKTNSQNALKELPFLFERSRSVAEKKTLVKPWHKYENFYNGVLNCRWKEFKRKGGSKVDQKLCGPGNLDCEFADNDFKNCNVEFVLKQIGFLHRMPILLYGVPAFDGFNYFHKYFVHSGKTIHPMTKRFMARYYRHFQNLRSSSESQVSDIVHFTLDRTLECMTDNGAAFEQKAVDSKRFCVFSSRSYAEIYWVLKYTFAVNYSNVILDLSKPPDLPVFGTSIIMLHYITFEAFKQEFKDTCQAIQTVEPMVDICRVSEVVDKFLDISGRIEEEENPETLFNEIKTLMDSWNNPNQALSGWYILLEAMFVIENIEDGYQLGPNKVMHSLNYKHLKSQTQVNALKNQGFVFDDFLIDKTNQNGIKMMASYLYHSFAKRKLLDIEVAFRSELKAVGPTTNLFEDFVTYEGYKTMYLYKAFLIYSPDLAFSNSIALKLLDLKLFFAVATIEISNDWIMDELDDYKKECQSKGNTLSCFYNLITRYQMVEDVKERSEELSDLVKESSLEGAQQEDNEDLSFDLMKELGLEEVEEVQNEAKTEKLISKTVIKMESQTVTTTEESAIVTQVSYKEDTVYDSTTEVKLVTAGEDSVYVEAKSVNPDFVESNLDQIKTGHEVVEKLTDVSPEKENLELQEDLKMIKELPEAEEKEQLAELNSGAVTQEDVAEQLKEVSDLSKEFGIDKKEVKDAEKRAGLSGETLDEVEFRGLLVLSGI